MNVVEVRIREVAALFLLIFFLYSRSLGNGFALDDLTNIVENPLIRSLANALDSFALPMYPGNLYRPLTTTSNALVYAVTGLSPLLHHLVNVLLHASNVTLVFILLCPLLEKRWAWLAALLFGVLPIHVETVANVTGRAELLCALFGLSALLCARKSHTLARVGLVTALFLCSMLSKENGVVWAPLAILLTVRHRLPLGAAFCVAASIYMALRWNALRHGLISSAFVDVLDNPLIALPASERVFWGIGLLGRYALLTLAPWSLGADYSLGYFDTPSLIAVLPFAATTVLLTAVAIWLPAVRLGLAWFLIAFIPASNILFPIGTIFGERLVYTPSIGLVSAAFALIAQGAAFSSSRNRVLLTLAFTCVYSACVWTLIPVWRDNSVLFNHQAVVSPSSAKTLSNFAVVLRNRGELDQATTLLKRALAIYPGYATAAYALGTVYLAKGSQSGAKHWLHEALKLNPDHMPTLQMLGRLYLEEGALDPAEKSFSHVLSMDPRNVPALNGMLAVAINRKDTAGCGKLIDTIQRLASQDPEFVRLRSFVR